jgi:hypothetical protein
MVVTLVLCTNAKLTELMRTFDSRTSNDAEGKGAIFRTLPVSLGGGTTNAKNCCKHHLDGTFGA